MRQIGTSLSAFALCGASLSSVAALAEPSSLSHIYCDDSARLERQLEDVHRAQKLGSGLRDPGSLLEVWIVPSNGEWSLVQTYANGTSCIVALGEDWTAINPAAGPT